MVSRDDFWALAFAIAANYYVLLTTIFGFVLTIWGAWKRQSPGGPVVLKIGIALLAVTPLIVWFSEHHSRLSAEAERAQLERDIPSLRENLDKIRTAFLTKTAEERPRVRITKVETKFPLDQLASIDVHIFNRGIRSANALKHVAFYDFIVSQGDDLPTIERKIENIWSRLIKQLDQVTRGMELPSEETSWFSIAGPIIHASDFGSFHDPKFGDQKAIIRNRTGLMVIGLIQYMDGTKPYNIEYCYYVTSPTVLAKCTIHNRTD